MQIPEKYYYMAAVDEYSDFLNKHSWWRRFGYTFPQTTTFDQSYYRNQIEAFIGLGYLIARDFRSLMK